MTSVLDRPAADEFAPYYGLYIEQAPAGSILEILTTQAAEIGKFLAQIPDARSAHRYAPDKWTLSEVLGHIVDSERVFCHRGMSFARGETQPLPGFSQDQYIQGSNYGERTVSSIAAEFADVRRATLAMYTHLTPEAWLRRGVASDNPVSVRATAYIIAGHAVHHLSVVKERYL